MTFKHSIYHLVMLAILFVICNRSSGTTLNPTYSKTLNIAAVSPTITNVSPATGTLGSIITLTGSNFTGATAVNFGNTPASSFNVISNTVIVAVVGNGGTGNVSVTTPSGLTSFPKFNYVPSNIATAKLIGKGARSDVGLGFPRKASRQKTRGTVKVSVIFVDFSDAVATQTPQSVFGIISPGTENFLSGISFGAINIAFDAKMKWYRMSKPSSGYGWSGLTFDAHKSYIQEAVNLADTEVDFSKADQILVVSNPYGGSLFNGPAFTGTRTNGITADGVTIANAITSGRDLLAFKELWFAHEFGHSMGLADLYAYSGQFTRFVGGWSMMGNILGKAPEYNAWEKWLLSWITDSQVRSVTLNGAGSINLTPIETKGGMKMLVLPIDQTSAVFVEDRRAIGFDAEITKEGPVVYLIDTKIASGTGVLKVLPLNDTDGVKATAPLSVGESVSYGNLTIKCIASGAGGSTIEYERK